MASFHGKLTLKSATTISLHERFTHLRNIKPIPATGPEPDTVSPPQSRPKPRPPSPPRIQEYYVPPRRSNSVPQYHGIFNGGGDRRHEDFDDDDDIDDRIPNSYRGPPRRETKSAVRSQQSYLQRQPRNLAPQLAMAAALRLKRRSIKQRLGQRPQNFYNYNQQNSPFKHRRFYNGFRGRRGGYRGRGRGGGMNRWNSSHSLASDGMGRGGLRRRGRGNWGRGRGGGRGRGRGGRYQNPKVTREDLDKELDSYMANTKTVLDKDLDEYMSQGNVVQ